MFDLLIEYWPKLLQGALLTLKLTFSAVIIAATLSLPLAILRSNHNSIWQWPIRIFVSFFRGTPLLAQLFLIYYGSGQFRLELTEVGLWWLFRDPFYCALLTFSLNSCAYQIEILRGALQAVNKGEIEAAIAIGMNKLQQYQKVILPHCYRIAFPALGNEIILLLKGSAIASVITLMDLMGHTRRVFSQTFDISVYLWAALMYLLITSLFVWLWRKIEQHLNRHTQRPSDHHNLQAAEQSTTNKYPLESANVR